MVETILEENNAIEIKYVCYECKKKFLLEDIHDGKTTDDKLICERCYEENYFTCDDCNEIEHNDYSFSAEEKILCESCYDNYTECRHCGKIKHNDSMSDELSDVCNRCFENHYVICYSCGEAIHSDDSYYCERTVERYCGDCYPKTIRCNLKSECKHILKYSEMLKEKSFNIFGVEIEANFEELNDYDITDKEELKHFTIVEDGSLDECGREFITCPLPNTTEGRNVLKTFCDTIGKKYLSIDSTCGLHIHFFFHRDLVNKNNLEKIIIAYSNLENFFFDMNPKSRRNNNYCRSLKCDLFRNMITRYTIEEMLEDFYEMPIRDIERVPEDKYYKHRYFWVNFNSIFYRNTIEIRLHSGSINYEKIINWYNIHRILLEYCISSSYEEIENLDSDKFLQMLPEDLRNYAIIRISKFKNNVEVYNQEE